MQQSWQSIAAAIKQAQATNSWKELGAQLSAARKEYAKMIADSGTGLKEVQPSMLRRCYSHDYSQPGSYMITIVAENRKAMPFGKLRYNRSNPKAAYIEYTPIGKAMLECLQGIPTNYPMVEVRKAQLMPDHMHLILVVHAPIVSKNGKAQHLGQVIAGYKKGCNRAYWALNPAGEPLDTTFPGAKQSIWARGYTDTIITGIQHMATEEAYLDDNPHRLAIKHMHKELFRTVYHVRVGKFEYAAIGNVFLLRKAWKECVQFHHWEHLCPPGFLPCTKDWNCSHFYKKESDGSISYYSAGEPQNTSEADAHTERLLKAGDQGAVFSSPFISEREKAVRNALLTMGCPYIRLTKEGFTDLYTPSKSEFYACAEGNLLILAPWGDRKRKEKITRPECKELNTQALYLCRHDLDMQIIRADGFEEIIELKED